MYLLALLILNEVGLKFNLNLGSNYIFYNYFYPYCKLLKRYFRNILNHGNNLISEIESQIQVLDGLTNFYYAAQGQRMNEIMKVLTIVSAIFIPLTFIVGVYGMNFENMPELNMKYGYYICWGIMVIITGILLFAFYKRGWFK